MDIMKPSDIAVIDSGSIALPNAPLNISIAKTNPDTFALNVSFVFQSTIENTYDADKDISEFPDYEGDKDYFISSLEEIYTNALNNHSAGIRFESRSFKLSVANLNTTAKKVNHQSIQLAKQEISSRTPATSDDHV